MTERFLDYGSPQALEAAIKATEDEHFVVYDRLLFATVCSDLPIRVVKRRMVTRPCGTSGGWTFVTDKTLSGGVPNPYPCDRHPKTHRHYLFAA